MRMRLPEQELQDLGRRQALDGGLDHALVSHGEALLQQALVPGLQRLDKRRKETKMTTRKGGRSAFDV